MNPLELLSRKCTRLNIRVVRDVREICEVGAQRLSQVEEHVVSRAVVERCLVIVDCMGPGARAVHWDINTAIAQALEALEVMESRERGTGTQV